MNELTGLNIKNISRRVSMKRTLYCFSLLMIIMALVGGIAWSVPCPDCTGTAYGGAGGIGVTGNFIGISGNPRGHHHLAVGCSGYIGFCFGDADTLQNGNTTLDTIASSSVSGSGWSAAGPTADGCYVNMNLTKTGTAAGTDTISVSAADSARCGSAGDDPNYSDSFQVDWVNITDLQEPKNKTAYIGDCPKYSVLVTPLPHDTDTTGIHAGYVKWYYTDAAHTTPQLLSSSYVTTTDSQTPPNVTSVRSVCYVSIPEPEGIHTITVRVEGPIMITMGNGIGTTIDTTITFNPLPTSNQEGTKCELAGGGSGGCSTGTCGGSGSSDYTTAGVQWRIPRVDPPNISVGGIGKDPAGQSCGDTAPSLMIAKLCGSLNWYFTSCSGKDLPVSFPQKTTTEDTSLNPSVVPIGSWTLTRTGASNASSWTYTAVSFGTTYTFGSGPSTDENERISFPKLSRIDYPDNSHDTFSVDANGNGTTNHYGPNGDLESSNTYTVTDGKITDIVNNDGTGIHIYRPSTGGFSPERIRTIDTKGTTVTTDDEVLSETNYTYNTDGRLSEVEQDGKQTGYTYTKDSSGNVTDITVTNLSASPQIVTQYTYGAATTTITQKHPTDSNKDQIVTVRFFTHNGIKTDVWMKTDPMGNVMRNGLYIATGTDVTNKTQNEDYIITTNARLYGKPFKFIDQAGNETEYSYITSTGAISTITYPDTTTETYAYYNDSNGNATIYLKTIKNRRGNYTHYDRTISALNIVNSIKTSTPVNGQEPTDWNSITADKEYEYYPSNDSHGQGGRIWKERIPNVDGTVAQETTYQYYEIINGTEKLRDDPTKSSYKYWDGSTYLIQYYTKSYDDAGQMLSQTDANSRTVYYTYDAKGRQLKTIYQSSPELADESSYTCCNLQWTKDPDGRETHYAYDDAGRMIKTWNNLSGQSEAHPSVECSYDEFGNKNNVTTYTNTSTGRTVAYTYDKNNHITKIDNPTPLGDEEFGYANTGQVQWKKDGNGYVILYKYDTSARLVNIYYNYTGSLSTISYPSSADVSYTYVNGSSLMASMSDSSGITSYGYDYKDRLISYTPPKPTGHSAITYTYNTLDQKTSMTNGSFVINYTYYAEGWLRDVKKGTSFIASYTYDLTGHRTRIDYGNGTYQTYTYNSPDPTYKLDKLEYAYRCAANEPVQIQGGIGITYDNSGNPLSWSALDISVPQKKIYSKIYSYDQMSRIDSAHYPGKGIVDFQYDWIGNSISPVQMEYNSADQLIRWPGEHRYEYDGRGNLIYEKSDSDTIQKTYTYSYSNLTSSISYAGVDKSTSMTWDALGNRIMLQSSNRINDSEAYIFINDITAGIPAVIEEIAPNGTIYYIREPDGSLIARMAVSGESSTTSYYHFDNLGSTQFLTSNDGTVSDKYSYDAWGNVISHVGNILQPFQFVGQSGYYSHWQDSRCGLINIDMKFYNPVVTRYTQHGSPYTYGANVPTIIIDPVTTNPSVGIPNEPPVSPKIIEDINGCGKKAPEGGGISAGPIAIIVMGAEAFYDYTIWCTSRGKKTKGLCKVGTAIGTAIGNKLYPDPPPQKLWFTPSDCKAAVKKIGLSEEASKFVCEQQWSTSRNCTMIARMLKHARAGHSNPTWSQKMINALEAIYNELCKPKKDPDPKDPKNPKY